MMPVSFYTRPEWLSLRYRVLKKYGRRCMGCGRGYQERVAIHVDHIMPVSKFPELSLVEDNLQVLCEECNRAKSNKYADDFRPTAETHVIDDEREIRRVLKTLQAAISEAETKGDIARQNRLLVIFTRAQHELRSGKTREALEVAIKSLISEELGSE